MNPTGPHPSPHFDCPMFRAFPQVQVLEDPRMVELGPLRTVRRTWRERLYDWPWTPWQATREERRWEPLQKAIYTGRQFICHPQMAHRLRLKLAEPYQTQQDPRTRPGHP